MCYEDSTLVLVTDMGEVAYTYGTDACMVGNTFVGLRVALGFRVEEHVKVTLAPERVRAVLSVALQVASDQQSG